MKKIALAALAAIALAGCSNVVADFDAKKDGADVSAENGYKSTDVVAATPLALQSAMPANLVCAAEQKFFLDFNYDVDEATVAQGIRFLRLQDNVTGGNGGAGGYTLSAFGDAYPATIQIVRNRIYFTLDCSLNATAQNVCVIDAAVLTGDRGTQKLDTNGNGIMGEAGDSRFIPFAVANNVAGTAPGPIAFVSLPDRADEVDYAPLSLLTGSGVTGTSDYNVPAGTNVFAFTLQDTGSQFGTSVAVEAGAVRAYKNAAGAWAEVSGVTVTPESPIPASGPVRFTVNLPSAPAKGEAYKLVVDRGRMLESAEVRGFTHRATYLPEGDAGRYTTVYRTFHRNAAAGGAVAAEQAMTATSGGQDFARWIDVVVPGTAPADLATITAATFKVRLNAGTALASGTAAVPFFAEWTLVRDQTEMLPAPVNANSASRRFRLHLPASVKDFAGAAGAGGVLLITPSVRTAAYTDMTIDTLSFGQADAPALQDGCREVAF